MSWWPTLITQSLYEELQFVSPTPRMETNAKHGLLVRVLRRVERGVNFEVIQCWILVIEILVIPVQMHVAMPIIVISRVVVKQGCSHFLGISKRLKLTFNICFQTQFRSLTSSLTCALISPRDEKERPFNSPLAESAASLPN